MKNYRNYLKDLQKSRRTPLLVELNKDDLIGFSKTNDMSEGFNTALTSAKKIYDDVLKSKDGKSSSTNVVYIDGNTINIEDDKCALLEQIVSQLEDSIKKQYNLNIVKEGTKTALSFGASGVIGNLFGDYIDKSVDFIADVISSDLTDELVEYAVDDLEVADKLADQLEDKVFAQVNDTTIGLADNLSKTKLYLSKEAEKFIMENSEEFGSDMAPSELYQLILKVILNVAIGSPIVIFIKNPHKLDSDSMALISLILSLGKDVKNRNNNIDISSDDKRNHHIGVSVVYAYEDETFQPYQACEEQYELKQTLLDEQRLFAQRYAMLERPNSDIPVVAVKSYMFVGRETELKTLSINYHELKKKMQYASEENDMLVSSKQTSFQVIQAEPGTGKTKLVNKHLEQLMHSQENGHQMIQLTLLNQVGHNSMNAGLGGLSKSIINEAQRLKSIDSLLNKGIDKASSFAKEKICDTILGLLDNNLGGSAKSVYDRATIDGKMQTLQESNMENNQNVSKEEEFEKLNSAIKTLEQAYDFSMPIVVFIDDLQWIDDKSAEYITQHLMKKFNVYIIATLRNSDATTLLRKAITNQASNEFTISLLEESGIIIDNEKHSNHTIETSQTQIIELKGLNESNLSELISFVIKGSKEQHHLLANTIIDTLTESNKEYVNTLFSVETINMLCDEKFYDNAKDSQEDKATLSKKLILPTTPLQFNDAIKDEDEFNTLLHKAFEILNKRYEDSLSHYNDSTEDDSKSTFNLMAYAVLEERLNILQSYFADHGNAAVNTLLFSSLLGAPFNSTIVENVLKQLSNTEDKLLQPLKSYINENNQKVFLNAQQYEIIEEVYEILSRYTAFTNAYEYRHSLLNIFLEKQLEYLLNIKVFKDLEKKIVTESKDEMYTLMEQTIKKEEKGQDFHGKPEKSLNTQMYENLLFFKQIYFNIFEKSIKNNKDKWADSFVESALTLSLLYKNIDYIRNAINVLEELLLFLEEEYPKNKERWAIQYSNALDYISYLYYYSQDISEVMTLKEKSHNILKEQYNTPGNKYFDSYMLSLLNLSSTYKDIGEMQEAFKYTNEAIQVSEKAYIDNEANSVEFYVKSLLKVVALHRDNNEISQALENCKKALSISKDYNEKNLNKNMDIQIRSLNNISKLYLLQKDYLKAISFSLEAYQEIKRLHEINPSRWEKDYIINSNALAKAYKDNKEYENCFIIESEVLERVTILFNGVNSHKWIKYYILGLLNCGSSHIINEKYEQALELFKKCLPVVSNAYIKNPYKYKKYYIECLKELIYLYKNDGFYTNQLEEELKKITE